MNKEEYNKQREFLFKKWDDLDTVIHILEATANVYYSPLDKDLIKGWNILLKKRDELKPFIDNEISKISRQIILLDKRYKKK